MSGERTPRAWHSGRTFYACACGAQAETHLDQAPAPLVVLDCWSCKAPGSMRQWTPSSIAQAKAA